MTLRGPQGSTSSPHFEVPRGRSRGRELVEPVPDPNSSVRTSDARQGRFLERINVGSGFNAGPFLCQKRIASVDNDNLPLDHLGLRTGEKENDLCHIVGGD